MYLHKYFSSLRRQMSCPSVLLHFMILLISSTFLPTITQALEPYERRVILSQIADNDRCRLTHHGDEGNIQCQEALNHFKELPTKNKRLCPRAQDAACRNIEGTTLCSFVCSPTNEASAAAHRNHQYPESTVKSLRAIVLSMPTLPRDRERVQRSSRRGHLQQPQQQPQQLQLHQPQSLQSLQHLGGQRQWQVQHNIPLQIQPNEENVGQRRRRRSPGEQPQGNQRQRQQ